MSIFNKLQSYLPTWTEQTFLSLKISHILAIFIILALAYFVKSLIKFLFIKFIRQKLKLTQITNKSIHKLTEPLGVFLGLFFITLTLPIISLPKTMTSFSLRSLYIAMAITFTWLGFRLVSLLGLVLKKWALKTQTKSDDILIPLIEKSCKALVLVLGIIFMAKALKVDVTSMLAGLGIGAMAFAFAAKDTLSNFFGSIMIVLDRPFDLGDYINVNNHDGIVEEVGFRSTRIRSFQDSVISIPNGQLANYNINNFGRRRFRRNDTTLGVEYDTAPELIEQFCEKIKGILNSKDYLKHDSSFVHFDGFGDFSLNINIRFYVLTQSAEQNRIYRHEVLLDLLKLGNDMGIGFAFPTQTLYMKNDTITTPTSFKG